MFLFTQNYEQDAVNTFSPFVLSPLMPLAVSQHSPQSTLDDVGSGVYGQATATFDGRLDVSAGARVDHENKKASLNTFFAPAIAPARLVTPEESFSNVSPQFSVALRFQPDKMVYGVIARGFKAGGFNAASPAGSEAYGEEHTWNLEGGVKSALAGGRVAATAAVFRIDWDDLQLNLPDPFVPAQFYIANVGGASSQGVELELNARVPARRRRFRHVRLHGCALRGRQRVERRQRVRATKFPTRPTTRRPSARSSRTRCGPMPRCTAAPRWPCTARSSTTT